MIHRRQFAGAILAGCVLTREGWAQTAGEWGSPVLDMHLHFRPNDGNFQHIEGSGVTQAVLLTPAAADEQAQAAIDKHPGRYVRFTSANITQPDGIEQMRRCLKAGALGMGEIKYNVAVDGPEMRRAYELAAEFHVPITIHFQEDNPVGGQFTTPFRNLPAVVKAYPNTTFIGHANAFWANISADVPPGTAYPTGKVKPGGLSDRMLGEFPNFYADLSANSGRNALGRDPDFAAAFLVRHQNKLMFGSDCPCRDGHGEGQVSQEPLIKGKCVARETLTALKQLTPADVFRKIAWENGHRVVKMQVIDDRMQDKGPK
ncbi:MAG: amidohydrolase [Acidobacteriota bacterium]|nr:amidohydrolase [Acidobacteriota bacterium]